MLSGELVGINKGFIVVKNESGDTKRMKTDDPRIISGGYRALSYGRPSYNKGGTLSEEHKEKVRIATKAAMNTPEMLVKMNSPGIRKAKGDYGRGRPSWNRGVTKHKTIDEFISSAKLIHGDLYEYELINGLAIKDRIKIKCLTHNNWFEQTISSHLKGWNGCSKCKYNNRKKILPKYLIKEPNNGKTDTA